MNTKNSRNPIHLNDTSLLLYHPPTKLKNPISFWFTDISWAFSATKHPIMNIKKNERRPTKENSKGNLMKAWEPWRICRSSDGYEISSMPLNLLLLPLLLLLLFVKRELLKTCKGASGSETMGRFRPLLWVHPIRSPWRSTLALLPPFIFYFSPCFSQSYPFLYSH